MGSKMVQYDLSQNAIYRDFKCLLSPWNMLSNTENQLRSSDLTFDNEKIRMLK